MMMVSQSVRGVKKFRRGYKHYSLGGCLSSSEREELVWYQNARLKWREKSAGRRP